MRTTYLFNIIIVCLAFLMSLFTIKTEDNLYSGYSEDGYAYNYVETNDAASETKDLGQPFESHPKMIHTSTDEKVPAGEEKTATAMTESFYYEKGDVRLIGEAGSLKENVVLSINRLDTNILPPLNAGMVNVTADYAAYRMLPHGTIFNKDIEVVLPYDTTLLPMGFTPNDIKSYYYDERYGSWIEIERDSVDMVNHLIISRVNHFTDFINAVIKTPEMPETSAYVPTVMSDIKAANPLEGINLMQPPTANNNGTANLSYPLEIPAGRNGMQPNLALTYNSGGGNGWLGVGWDISVPAITVETRWGVPRYNTSLESEVYVLGGEQLVTKDNNDNFNPMPHRTNVWKNRMPNGTQFYPRVNEVFDSIVRHGTGPTDYWWSVTDRNGITNYYGKRHGVDSLDLGSVLRDANGNIAHWALTESVDPYGNNVKYYYDIVHDSGVPGSSNDGIQIYISSINYTGLNNQSGEYEVVFTRRPNTRRDVTISAKYGFKEVTSEILCNVTSRYNNEIFSCYFFYTENCRASQYKTRLIDMIKKNIDSLTQGIVDEYCFSSNFVNGNIARYHFDYYDAPSGNAMFGNAVTQTFNNPDNIQSHFITGLFNNNHGQATALGATKGKSWSLGGTAAVGVGLNVCMTSISLGGNFDYSRSQSEGILTMIDLDGDGLADKVFKDGNTIKYRKQIATGDNSFTFSPVANTIEGVSDFLNEVSSTTTWGLQASAGVSYSGSWPKTKSTTTTYFSDVNADGLPDLITEEGVLFNTTQKNGSVKFQSFYSMVDSNIANNTDLNQVIIPSTSTCGGIIYDGEVNDSIACEVSLVLDSTIFIKGDSASFAFAYVLMDSLLNTGEYECTLDSFMRGTFELRIFKKTVRCEPIALDPDMDAVKVWVAPKDGFINIHSDFRLLEDTSVSRQQSKYVDGVRYTIQLDTGITADTNLLSSSYSAELYSQVVAEDDYERYEVDTTIYVNEGDVIFFRLQSQGNRSFDKVNWEQTIEYDTYNGNMYSNHDIYGINEDYYNSKQDFVITGKDYFQAHKNGIVKITTNITTGNYLYDQSRLEITYHICEHQLYTKKIIDLQPNMNLIDIIPYFCTEQYDSITFHVINFSSTDPTWSNICIQPKIEYLYFDTSSTLIVRLDTIYYYPPVNLEIENYLGTPKDSLYHDLFGPLYRGWGQFAYNNNDSSLLITDPIDINTLVIDKIKTSSNPDDTLIIYRSPNINDESSQEEATASYDSQGMYHPLSSKTRWIQMSPNSQYWTWVGYGNINYLNDTMMTNTRMPEYITVEETSNIPEYDHPVPQSLTENYEVKTVRKCNRSELKNHSLSLGIPLIPISIGFSSSKGENTILSDYMDLNGDRYPDIMGPVYVQYTMPWGGIGTMTPLEESSQNICLSKTKSRGKNFGASYSMPSRGTSNNPKNAKISFDGQGSVSYNVGKGSDNTDFMWMDMNGDGLPDRVHSSGTVEMNLGYKFSDFGNWNQGNIRSGKSNNECTSLGLGSINIAQASIGGGLSINSSENTTDQMLMDFNGDGLPDKVSKSNTGLSVNYNYGNGSWSSAETVNIQNISAGTSFSESINLSGTLGFTLFGILKITVGIQGSPYNRSFSKDKEQLIDINGDGYIDYVTSTIENSMVVRYNQTGKANLLKQVTNFTGSKIEMDYQMPLSSFEQPQRSWVLDTVRTEDPYTPAGGGITLTTFIYKNPHYDRYERIAYGYDTVIVRQHYTENNNSVYRYTVQGYNNDNFFKRGKKKSETTFDSYKRPYIETLYDLVMVDLSDTTIIGDSDCPAYGYPKYESEIKNYFEGQSTAQLTTKKSFQYDNHRNVIKYINFGDTTINDDNLRADISYKKGMGYNLISLADTIKVYDQSGNSLRKRMASYNSKGKMTQIQQYNSGTTSVTDITYENTYGNIDRITFPPNDNNQRLYYEYDFDPVVHSYPVQVTNALGYYSSATYDYRWGKPLVTTDINGNEMHYSYDFMGRAKTITAPYELASGQPYTIKMEYHPVKYGRVDIFNFSSPDTFSFARTYHYNSQNDTNDLRTTLLCDGFGRILQTKKDAEINGQEVSIVSGKIIYDAFGRTTMQYHPFTEPLTQDSVFNHSFNSSTETVTKYDILDRQIEVILPTGDITAFEYEFNGTQFLTRTIDANGNTTTVIKDGRGLQREIMDADSNITSFEYNAMGELVNSTDPDGHSTDYEYDMLGQKIARFHPDAGLDRFQYDRAGNLIFRQTQNLQNNNDQWIEYKYHYNQLTNINYPENPENNVIYEYGAMSATNNRAGKIVRQEDASGYQEFSYGALGEITENIRTFVLPNETGTYTFAMNFEYDSWNRILNMTYPDGEVVNYHYNVGGLLKSMDGVKGNVNYNYIDAIIYNKFESKTRIDYGNGTYATYKYDDTLQRLQFLNSYNSSGEKLQDIEYTFDNVNNITKIKNVSAVLNNGLGGSYESHFTYDNMYRLTNAVGSWDNGQQYDYELSMDYSHDGIIKFKNLTAKQLLNGNQTILSYKNVYSYNNTAQPHTLTHVDDNGSVNQDFEWDANGNLVIHDHELLGYRKLCWDEENRLMGVTDKQFISYYTYDAGGERTYKLTGAFQDMIINGQQYNYNLMNNPTLYTSPYLVATPQGYTKHFYAGSERILSKIGCGGLERLSEPIEITTGTEENNMQGMSLNAAAPPPQEPDPEPEFTPIEDKIVNSNYLLNRTVNGCLGKEPDIIWDNLINLYELEETQCEKENDLYYYHPDHLGSGTWITYTDGSAIQHLHYLPFGEEQIDQRLTSFNSRYTFSAKEKDIETGYSYFGARYYTSDLSIWLSVDPMADNTPFATPYAYCINNPIILHDPNGEDWYEADDGKTLSYVHGKTDDMEGYKHLGAKLDKEHGNKLNNGEYSTLNISANLTDKDFVTQMGENGKSIMSCAKAAGAMSMKRGGKATSYANELPMVTEGENGRAGDGISSNLFSAIGNLANSLLEGIPIVAGVDYHNGSPNDKKNGGDGMTDHYVAITGISLSLTKGRDGQVKYTGGSFQYANPGNRNSAQGLSSNNMLNFNSNGWRASNSRYVLTTMRVK